MTPGHSCPSACPLHYLAPPTLTTPHFGPGVTVGKFMGQAPPSSSCPLPGHLSKSYFLLMRRKQVALGWVEPGALKIAGPRPRKACTTEIQGDMSPQCRGRGSLAGTVPLPEAPSHLTWSLLCLRGWHEGEVEVSVRKVCEVSGWLRTFPTSGLEELQPDQLQKVGSGHLRPLSKKVGERSRQLPKAAGTRCPRTGFWRA